MTQLSLSIHRRRLRQRVEWKLNNIANQQPPIDTFQKDPSRPSYEDLGNEQCGQKDDENIHNSKLMNLYSMNMKNGIYQKTYKSISEINYTKLNSISVRLIGCYGNRHLIARRLLNLEIINQQIYELLISSQPSFDYSNKPFLRPGIYFLVVNPDFSLVIHWPEVTEHQLCLMSEEDLESFDWNLYNTDVESDDDKGFYEFEVKKSQEVDLFDNIKTELQNTQEDVIESATNQSFATRKLTKETSCMRGITMPVNEWEFSQKL
ncbi:935_t:CDS:2 [Funneliformis mosseae]|uniref:935_t:CDS:1 n=1 Tax=Funneliformis mosseae TaxID=27381 RepID=A0A9N9F423_FUNMO|nr:935_t:CDS:2 [Funneliformis mosseae]